MSSDPERLRRFAEEATITDSWAPSPRAAIIGGLRRLNGGARPYLSPPEFDAAIEPLG